MTIKNTVTSSIELGQLLANTIESVVSAQEKMDDYTERRRQHYEDTPRGQFALPPLYYVFNRVQLDLELEARVDTSWMGQPRMLANTLNPATVALHGREASASLRVSIEMTPKGFVPVKDTPQTHEED